MNRVNRTIDNVDPLIVYNLGWKFTSASESSLASNYYDQTFTLTQDPGASATFTFNGTGVWVFGSKGTDHDFYNVTVDGAIFSQDGYSAGPIWQDVLFGTSNLARGAHSVTLTNAPRGTNTSNWYLDLDCIIWETEIGVANVTLTESTIEDSNSSFSYEPAAAWMMNPPDINDYSGGSGHQTTTNNATVTFSFIGNSVQIYGTIGPNNGLYAVKLDDAGYLHYNASYQETTYQVMLYSADSIGPGAHRLTIINQEPTGGRALDIDFAVVTSTPSEANTTSNSASAVSSSSSGSGASSPTPTGVLVSSNQSSSSNGEIAGGAIAGAVLLAAVLLLACWWRKRRGRTGSQMSRDNAFGVTPFMIPGSGPGSSQFDLSDLIPNPELWPPSQRPIGSSRYSSSSQVATISPSELSAVGNENDTMPSANFTSTSIDPIPVNHTPTNPSSSKLMLSKTLRRILGNTVPAQPSLQSVPASNLVVSSRMFVPGRAQDMGPIPLLGTSDEESGGLLPPDYSQALEPFPVRWAKKFRT